MNKIRVMLADDHSLVRKGFRRMLEDEADFDVVGEASNGLDARTRRRAGNPRDCPTKQSDQDSDSQHVL
jgi:DNA-binding NarL/FixJ family response regulator